MGVLKAPFPAFGGKSQVADLVWERLGDPRNFIEPCAFSSAMLLRRPAPGPIETINDLNAYVANFWRAVQNDPEAVATHADWPVNETDLHARHAWLVRSSDASEKLQKVCDDPTFYDAKIAGWWCWGACCWIGSGWCDEQHRNSHSRTRPDLEGQLVTQLPQQIPDISGDGSSGRSVHAPSGSPTHKKPQQSGGGHSAGVHAKRPSIANDGSQFGKGILGDSKRPALCCGNTTGGPGVHRKIPLIGDRTTHGRLCVSGGEMRNNRPHLADAYSRGRGIHGNDVLSRCAERRAWIIEWFMRLADRLRTVRVCCGHCLRVCDSPSTLTRLGLTGVFWDPPYRKKLADGTINRHGHIYANDRVQDVGALCDEVQDWCIRWGDDPLIRIALCGLEGEYPLLDAAGWEKMAWKSNGGYGNRSQRGKDNSARERIWFNKGCQRPKTPAQGSMFSTAE